MEITLQKIKIKIEGKFALLFWSLMKKSILMASKWRKYGVSSQENIKGKRPWTKMICVSITISLSVKRNHTVATLGCLGPYRRQMASMLGDGM